MIGNCGNSARETKATGKMVIYSNGESSSGKRTDKSTTIRLVVIRRHEIVKEDTGGNEPISRDRGSA
jgi:hypothetical protein